MGDVLQLVDGVTPGWYKRLEEGLQESLAGLIGDEAREFLANFEIPESLEDFVCEINIDEES